MRGFPPGKTNTGNTNIIFAFGMEGCCQWKVSLVMSNELYDIISAAKNVTAKSEFPVVSPILQILPVTGQIF